ncbi:Ldh family oxidoreductase [Pseudomonas sp. S1(2024)]|uniref:Ldh family oxidoreductase n=1 Tax=Pseudomonas sp. S1(2024) TaxID=3390191 RepID=UPI00397985D3
MEFQRIAASELHGFTVAALSACGVPEHKAQDAAQVLQHADLAGHDTHGIANLGNVYMAGILGGDINPLAEARWACDLGACATLDAGGGLGLLAGRQAMTRAIDKARDYGVGCVVVRNSSHFGAAGFYAGLALEHQMIGMAMTNLGRETVAHPMGSVAPLIGTNPISLASPVARAAAPFWLDMSTTVCASGKVKQAIRRQQTLPPGWLLDAQGRAVEDPRSYLSGSGMLPMLGGSRFEQGGHKGFGLGLMVDILCGALSGAQTGADQMAAGRNDIGHFFLVLRPDAFGSSNAFTEAMDRLLKFIHDAPVHEGFEPLRYPGEPDAQVREERLRLGVPVDEALLAQLDDIAARLGIAPLKRTAA